MLAYVETPVQMALPNDLPCWGVESLLVGFATSDGKGVMSNALAALSGPKDAI
jgi:hypothetical protein